MLSRNEKRQLKRALRSLETNTYVCLPEQITPQD